MRKRLPDGNQPRSRDLRLELLEDRRLLVASWQNPFPVLDVSRDDDLSPIDVLFVVNKINLDGVGPLPDEGPGAEQPFFDTNGDGFLSPVDALLVVNAINRDNSNPFITFLRLEEDSGRPGDLLTNHPVLIGEVRDNLELGSVHVSVNGLERVSATVSLEDERNGEFRFDLESFLGDQLSDGSQTLDVFLHDKVGNRTVAQFQFELERVPPDLTVELEDDSGVSDSDRISQFPTILGNVQDNTQLFSATVQHGAEQPVSVRPDGDGDFAIDPRDIISPLTVGQHSLLFRATDRAGNVTEVDFSFLFDTVTPTLEVDLIDDTGTRNDDFVSSAVTFTGNTRDLHSPPVAFEASVDESAPTVISPDQEGRFTFQPQDLQPGSHTVEWTAIDVAGNSHVELTDFVFDNVAPELGISLLDDTGPNSSDLVSSAADLGIQAIDTHSSIATATLQVDDQAVPFTLDDNGLAEVRLESLAQGIHDVVLKASDIAGNDAESRLQFLFDNVAPTASIALIIDSGQSTSDKITADPRISGSVDDATSGVHSVTATIDDNDPIAMTLENGRFEFDPRKENIEGGRRTVRFDYLDVAGNLSSDSLSFIYDPIQPTIDVTLASDTGSQDDDNVSMVDKIVGSVSDSLSGIATLHAKLNDFPAQSVTVNRDGTFEILPQVIATQNDAQLSDGHHRVRLTAIDVAGNEFTHDVEFHLDRTRPELSAALKNDTGVPDDNRTSSTVFAGTTKDEGSGVDRLTAALNNGTPVNIFDTLELNGMFEWDPRSLGSLAQGAHQIKLQSHDLAGNLTELVLPFVFDSAPPDVTAQLVSDTGSDSADWISQDPQLKGEVSDVTSAVLSTVQVSVNGEDPKAVNLNDGEFTFDPRPLADGDHVINVTATDVVGNAIDVAFPFTLDTTAPTLEVDLKENTSNNESTRLTSKHVFAGTVGGERDAITLSAFVNDGSATAVDVRNDGTFEFNPGDLADGTHRVKFEASDVAGNVRGIVRQFIFDTTPPTASPKLQEDTGSKQNDGYTSIPVIVGTVSDATGGFKSTGTAKLNDLSPREFNIASDGSFQVDPRTFVDALSEGEHRVEFTFEDLAGNSSAPIPIEFTYDTIPPRPGSVELTNDTGTSNDDLITFDARMNGVASLDLADTDRLSAKATQTAAFNDISFNRETGVFSVAPELSDGTHTASFRAIDLAGNASEDFSITFTLDTVVPAPVANLNDPLARRREGVVDRDASIVGNATDERTEIATVSASLDSLPPVGVPFDSSGDFLFDPLELGSLVGGQHRVSFQAMDVAGNQSDATIVTFVVPGVGVLVEGNNFFVELSRLETLALSEGAREISVEILAEFDKSLSGPVEDTFVIYLVEPDDRQNTLLSSGGKGDPLFQLSGDLVHFQPGKVRYDGRITEIDVSSLTTIDEGLLIFQLINHDLDHGSRVWIRDPDNEIDGEGLVDPVFPLAGPDGDIGPAVNIADMSRVDDVRISFENVQFDPITKEYQAELRLHNEGESQGRQLAVVFPPMPEGVTIEPVSETLSDGRTVLNLKPSIHRGGLGKKETSDRVKFKIKNNDLNLLPLDLLVLAGPNNRAPSVEPIDDVSMVPGEAVSFRVNANDQDGDPLDFRISAGGDLPHVVLTNDGVVLIRPWPGDVGVFGVEIEVHDGEDTTKTEFEVTVNEDEDTETRITGTVLDKELNPLSGIPIEMGQTSTVTNDRGEFELRYQGAADSDNLLIHGQRKTGPKTYPFVAEKVQLLLEREMFVGHANDIPRPIFLPEIDVENAVQVNADQDTTVTTPRLPEASLLIKANTAKDEDGDAYDGKVGITEVEFDRTPAALPRNSLPDVVVTVQPAGVNFTEAAPLDLPNVGQFPAGSKMNLWSINPATGQFDLVGEGEVSDDGKRIETKSGGVQSASWHFFVPPPIEALQLSEFPRNEIHLCGDCKELAYAHPTADVVLHSGVLLQRHELPSYQSFGAIRTFQLVYDSLRADPRPIVHFGYENAPSDDGRLLVANLNFNVSGSTLSSPGLDARHLGLTGNEHFWRLHEDIGRIDAAIQGDLTRVPSGIVDFEVQSGFLRDSGDRFVGSRVVREGQMLHVNGSDSPFGAGWGLAGLQHLIENENGDILLVDGDGSEVKFTATDRDVYISPTGDFSELQKTSDGFVRAFPDHTLYEFDADLRLIRITDRNSNHTLFEYNSAGQLVEITDEVGLVTEFAYDTAGRVSTIKDPAERVTRLSYDQAGRLVEITGPESAIRRFDYDARNHLTDEWDERGFHRETNFNFAGRVRNTVDATGATRVFSTLQSQVLRPLNETTDYLMPPLASRPVPSLSYHTDGKGHTTVTELDQAGQKIQARDGVGSLGQVVRNSRNLIAQLVDGRGNVTAYKYDDVGNIIEISDGRVIPGESLATAGDLGTLVGKRSIASAVANHRKEEFVSFQLDAQQDVWLRLHDVHESIVLSLIQDTNGNGVVDVGETISTVTTNVIPPVTLFESLAAGTYFVSIASSASTLSNNSSYVLDLEIVEPPINPKVHQDNGNAPRQAEDIGLLAGEVDFRGQLSGNDIADFFAFEVAEMATITGKLTGLEAGVRFALVVDVNQNNRIDSSDFIGFTANSANPHFLKEQLGPGNYLVYVYRASGDSRDATPYFLNLDASFAPPTTPRDPGNSPRLGLPVDLSAGPLSFVDSVDIIDSRDYYNFTITTPGTVTAKITDLAENLDLALFHDVDGDGVHDSNEWIELSVLSERNHDWITEQLAPGSYSLLVYQPTNQTSQNGQYHLEVFWEAFHNSPSLDPGNAPASAFVISDFDGPRIFVQTIGAADSADYYRFVLDEPSTVTARLGNTLEDVNLAIVADLDGDGLHDSNEWIDTSQLSDLRGDEWVTEELAAGEYYFVVTPRAFTNEVNSFYQLEVNVTPSVITTSRDPGNVFAQALVIDDFDDVRIFRDNVGSLDTRDLYRFDLSSPSTVSAHLRELEEDLELAVVADINGNGVLDTDEWLEISRAGQGREREWLMEELPAGTHYFLVFQDNFDTDENSDYLLEVDVFRVPPSNSSDPGETFASALEIEDFDSELSFEDTVGALDRFDLYGFSVATPSRVTAELTGLSEDIDLAVVTDINGNQILDGNEYIEESKSQNREWLIEELPVGKYYFLVFQDVFQTVDNSHYQLTVDIEDIETTTATDPGDSLATARVISNPTQTQTFVDVVGSLDRYDFYRFDLGAETTLDISLETRENIDLQLIQDADNDGIVDSGEVIAESRIGDQAAVERIIETLAPGRYYLAPNQRVFQTPENSRYVLGIRSSGGATSVGDPGENFATATPLGTLGDAVLNRRNRVTDDSDEHDFYSFQLNELRDVRFALTGMTQDADLRLLADLNGNGVADSNEVINSSDSASDSNDFMREILGPGTYYVDVEIDQIPRGQATNYDLEVASSIVVETNGTEPNDIPADAHPITVTATPQTILGSVGSHDGIDLYRFTLTSASELQLTLDGMTEDADLRLLVDVDNNGTFSSAEVSEFVDTFSSTPAVMTEAIPPGTYYIEVHAETFPRGQNTPYSLEYRALPLELSDVGESNDLLTNAHKITLTTETQSLTNVVGITDSEDLFEFSLTEPSGVRIGLDGLREGVDLSIITDLNGNTVISSDEVTDFVSTGGSDRIWLTDVLGPGKYYIRVRRFSFPNGESSDYRLLFDRFAVPFVADIEPNNGFATATPITVDSTLRSIRDTVGVLDTADFYEFTLDSAQELHVRLSQLREQIDVFLVSDLDNDGALELGEYLDVGLGDADQQVIFEDLPPGPYAFVVEPVSFPYGQASDYLLEFWTSSIPVSTPRDPGNDYADALDIGELRVGQAFRDVTGTHDAADFYRFELVEPREVRIQLTDLTEATQVALYADANGNGTYDSREEIEFLSSNNLNAVALTERLTPGVYYVGVTHPVSTIPFNSRYQLQIETEVVFSPRLVRRFTYDPEFSQLASERDEIGRVTLYDVDPSNGNTTSKRVVIGKSDLDSSETDDLVTTFEFTPQGLIKSINDPRGIVTEYGYDARGRLEEVTEASGLSEEVTRLLEHDSAGNITSLTDENGNRTTFEYDAQNRLTKQTTADPDGDGSLDASIEVWSYDAAGNLLRHLDPRNSATTFAYDGEGRVIQTTLPDPDGNGPLSSLVLQTIFDSTGNPVESSQGDSVTEYRYDGRNRQRSTKVDETVIELRYDVDDNLVRRTDAAGNATNYVYDHRDRLITEIDPRGRAIFYEYDGVNNLVAEIDRTRRATKFQYDDAGRLVHEDWLSTHRLVVNTINYTYDDAGNLLTASDLNSSLEFTYDARNRNTSAKSQQVGMPTVQIDYSVDGAGNLLQTKETIGSTTAAVTDYTYDALNRATTIIQSGTDVAVKRVDFGYDSNSQTTSLQRFRDAAGSQAATHSTAGYDDQGRMVALYHRKANDVVAFYDMTYGDYGELSATESVDGTIQYRYDADSQLIATSHSSSAITNESYAYDANGNRTSSHRHAGDYKFDSANRLVSDGVFDYGYDQNGNLIDRTKVDSGVKDIYAYDNRNRLSSIVTRDENGVQQNVVTYTYDVLNRRISEAVDAEESSITYFAYDRDDLILEFLDPDGPGDGEVRFEQRYFHGPGIDHVLAQEDGSQALEWLLSDERGTIRDIANAQGAVANHVVFDSFGNLLSQTDDEVESRFGFMGRQQDNNTGLHYYRNRYYDPSVGRFLTEDPSGFSGGDNNLYRFVRNNPVTNSDPSGLATVLHSAGFNGRPGMIPSEILFVGLMSRTQQLQSSRSTSWLYQTSAFLNQYKSASAKLAGAFSTAHVSGHHSNPKLIHQHHAEFLQRSVHGFATTSHLLVTDFVIRTTRDQSHPPLRGSGTPLGFQIDALRMANGILDDYFVLYL